MTPQEANIAIDAFRKETEDLVMALVRNIFNIQYGEAALIVGTISIPLPVPYLSTLDYEVVIFSAIDADGTDIKDSLAVTKSTASGLTILSSRAGMVRWETVRRSPQINFWTE